jgi:hypothetical protein
MNRQPRDDDKSSSETEPESIRGGYILDSASGLYIPKPEVRTDDSRDKDKSRDPRCSLDVHVKRDWLIIWMSVLTLLGIVGTVIYTARQWKATDKAANAARDAADTGRDTLIASNRPWLDVDISIVGPLMFDSAGAHLEANIITSNLGHSPAIHVAKGQEFIQVIAGSPNPWQEIKRRCQSADGQSALPANRGVTQTIFPGKPQSEHWNLTLSLTEMSKEIIPGERLPFIYPAIVWCVAYGADFSKSTHHTGYAWNVLRSAPQLRGGIGLIDPSAGNVPAGQLLAEKYPFIGPFAD